MIVVDKRKKHTVPVEDVCFGMVFEDLEGTLFMRIDLDGSCFPSHLDYNKTVVAVNLDDFDVCFFDNTTEVCLVHKAELVLS
jgi:hypothetical protein